MGMRVHVRACPKCRTATLRGECPVCGDATAAVSAFPGQSGSSLLENDGSHADAQLRQPPDAGNNKDDGSSTELGASVGALLPPPGALEARLELAELQCRMYYDQLQQVITERDELQEKVRAMEAQRLLGTGKIRELVEENRCLRAVAEEAEVRLGVAELEQQALLAEVQRLRGRIPILRRQAEAERPPAKVGSPDAAGGALRLSPLAKTNTTAEQLSRRRPSAKGGFSGTGHGKGQRALAASNEHLQARCRSLERHVRRLREELVSQGLSPSPMRTPDYQTGL
ncbi:uncharacterized protein Tco025E_00179 [Trypanosoma conorhini]|uniref:Uncharacterized protein n=1 Tax=Trypanosoma conorhini TaxID=83891 RepID=A0A3R7M6J8_9TRYP|nr:uncharacterized protein Tco025E_00179 [Trypanosoma conorhini]RNF27529.1 hypothetical protein Tco025E_00179 [Trypanosoma conorhini]